MSIPPAHARSPLPALSSLVLATRNAGKVRELSRRLDGLGLHLTAAPEEAPPVEEDAPTLVGNALKKARALHVFTGRPALADDTGLEVDALGGQPGVHSARFAGPEATDADNRRRLLERLAATPEAARSARFRTVLALVTADGERTFEGVCEGRIERAERGAEGFGYDALFVPEGHRETFAEMPLDLKNRISHRARALDAFVAYLEESSGEAGRRSAGL